MREAELYFSSFPSIKRGLRGVFSPREMSIQVPDPLSFCTALIHSVAKDHDISIM